MEQAYIMHICPGGSFTTFGELLKWVFVMCYFRGCKHIPHCCLICVKIKWRLCISDLMSNANYTADLFSVIKCSKTLPSAIHRKSILWSMHMVSIDPIHKSQNAPVPYPTVLHSEQKCAHFCSEWSIVGYGTDAFWDFWNRSIGFVWFWYIFGA